MPGFDYRIHYNQKDLPDTIMFMIPEHRYNWVRYGDVMFLNASKTEQNKLGWSYIAPGIRTNENKMGITSEAIVVSETHEMYMWILRMQIEIECGRELSSI